MAKKRGKNLGKLQVIIQKLVVTDRLESNYHDHPLVGNYIGRRECHIESDWLLLYKREGDIIIFERTGTHSDLFK